MTATHQYDHPERKALGDHHSQAEGRPPFDAETAKTRGLSDYEIEVMTLHHERMVHLDLHHGTQVEWSEVNPNGTHRIEWTDRDGTHRATSVSPEFFASNFAPLSLTYANDPTGSSRQEADFARGDFHRCKLPSGHESKRSNWCEACNQESADARVAEGSAA